MPEGIEDNRGPLGRAQSGGDAGRQNPERADSDRSYGARDGQRAADRGRGDGAPAGGGPSQYSGDGGSRTDAFGARDDQPGDDTAGWREVGVAGPDEHLGGEDERPG